MNEEWPMPLLCISLLALLLLPLSLSCDTKRSPEEVSSDFMATVQTDLDNTRENITTTLQNSSCPELKHKPHSCVPNGTDFVTTLHKLTCKMKKLGSPTDGLVTSVLSSIRCPCPTKGPKDRLKKRGTSIRQRNETRKLCKVKEILSTMTKCYEMLNTIHGQTPNSSTLWSKSPPKKTCISCLYCSPSLDYTRGNFHFI